MKKEDLIDNLVDDLQEYKPVRPVAQVVGLWFLLLMLGGFSFALFAGAFRENIGVQLGSSIRFSLEVVLFLSLSFLLAWRVLGSGVPGYKTKLVSLMAVAASISLAGLLSYSVVHPALEVSMAGKRPHCFLESILVGSLISFSILVLLRRRAAFDKLSNGLISGAAGVLIMAGFMHTACMYDLSLIHI